MVKKLKAATKADDKQLASAVRTSAQQIWQAGLGAFAKAQEEGGKVFTKLVKEGTDLQKRTQKMAEDKVSDVTGTVTKMAGGVTKQATGSWDKLETVFEERVARALTSIGVPTQKDIQLLTQRVEQLSKAVSELSGKKSAPSSVKTASKPTSAKAEIKPAPKSISKPTSKSTAKPIVTKEATPSTGKAAASTATPKARAKKAPAKVVPETIVNETGTPD